MWILFLYFVFVNSIVSNITAGAGLDGGTITDFGTISLSNISPNVSGTWITPSQITVNSFGQVTNITNVLYAPFVTPTNSSTTGNFSNLAFFLNNQGRITQFTNGTTCIPEDSVSNSIIGTTTDVFASTSPISFVNITVPINNVANDGIVIFMDGYIKGSGGSATLGYYIDNILISNQTYVLSTLGDTFFFQEVCPSPTAIPNVLDFRISVTSGATATLFGPFTLSYTQFYF